MKRFFHLFSITICLILTYAEKSKATECMTFYFDYWPKSKVIKANSIFVLEWFGNGSVFQKETSKYKYVLQSEQEEIPLIIKEHLKGINKDQAICHPAIALMPGSIYKLKLYHLPGCRVYEDTIKAYNPQTQKNEPAIWTITSETDVLVPVWNSPPQI